MITKVKVYENEEVEDLPFPENPDKQITDPIIVGARIISLREGSMLAIQNWQFSGIFSATDYRIVAWAEGTLTLPSGQSFTIAAGNTGNMAALTYIYFDQAVSKTVLQVTTTAATAIGVNKILIAVAQNNADTGSDATFQVLGGTGGLLIKDANIAGATITSAKVKPSLRGSSHDLVFSATDADTVAWASGTITLSNGDSYSIDAGNTGDMSARTYIYLDVDTSATVLQISTTFSDAVGDGKILIASAKNGTGEAVFSVLGGIGGINIDANSIIVANLAAIKADLGSITAGNITLDSSGFIKGGQTAYNTGTGFFLGYDTDAYKFSIGVSSGDHVTWDGNALTIIGTITGSIITGGTVRTSASGNRIELYNDLFTIYDASGKVFEIEPVGGETSLTIQKWYDTAGELANVFATRTGALTGDTQRLALQTPAESATYVARLSVESGKSDGAIPPTIEIHGDFVPTDTATYDIGSASLKFKNLYLSGLANVVGLDVGSQKITNLLTPVADTDAANKGFVVDTINAAVEDWVVASDVLKESDDTVGSAQHGSYTKVKEIEVSVNGVIRVKFDIASLQGGITAYGKIYINGVARGTERSTNDAPNYDTFSEDFNVTTGDLVQLYVKCSSSSAWRNFRLYWDVSSAKSYIDAQVDTRIEEYIEITPPAWSTASQAQTWEEWDLSSYIPAGAKYAEIIMQQGHDADRVGIRKKGSSLNRYLDVPAQNAINMTVELDADRIVERYDHQVGGYFTVVGYWK